MIRFQPGPILAEIPAITGRLRTGSSSTMAAQIWVAPAHCRWTCRAQRHPAWWLRWVRMAMRIWLIAVTSADQSPVPSAQVSIVGIIQAAAMYRTNQGTYVAFRGSDHSLSTFRITATSPPTIDFPVWSVPGNACGSPFVTSADGTNDMIVWVVGSGGDQHLHGYSGDTGAVNYAGGDPIAGTHGTGPP